MGSQCSTVMRRDFSKLVCKFLFRFLRNETVLFWIRCELFTQWGLLSNEKSARNHNVNTFYSWQIVGKQCRKNMFFKYRKDNRQ